MKKQYHADKYIFYVCLGIAIALFVGGFFCPPMGVIDGSVLKAVRILLGLAVPAGASNTLANGKDVECRHNDTQITIGDNDNE